MNTVKIMIRAKIGGKYSYLPVLVSSNGRIKPNVGLVGGVQYKVEGSYYLRFTEGANVAGSLYGPRRTPQRERDCIGWKSDDLDPEA